MSGIAYHIFESERLPDQIGAYEFHYSRRFEMAALACPCGCGHRVMLNLLDQHHLVIEGGLPTITPSILVSDASCLSHFFLQNGRVVWAQQWSKSIVDRVMRSQVQFHVEQGNRRKPQPSIMRRCVDYLKYLFDW